MPLRPLLERLYPELRAYARALLRDPAGADDLAGEAVARALAAAAPPETLEALRPWLFRTIRNLHVDDWRAERVRAEHRAEAARLRPAGEARAEDDALGRRAFARLSPEHREALLLIDVLGFSYDETARLIGAPRGTVMSRISRARAAMLAEVRGTEER